LRVSRQGVVRRRARILPVHRSAGEAARPRLVQGYGARSSHLPRRCDARNDRGHGAAQGREPRPVAPRPRSHGGSTRPGIMALKKVAGVRDGDITAGQVGFRLGPRINAAGRMDAALKVVQMLTTTSSDEAVRIAEELDAHNRERQAMEAKVLEAALETAGDEIGERRSLVLGDDGWHPGVLGIVASRIVERFHRPTVVVGFQNGEGKGSARGIRGFHVVDGFRSCADLLEKFGGHEYAGGLTIRREKFTAFAERFEDYARQSLAPEDLTPFVEVDAQLDFSAIGMDLMKQLGELEPFGIGNPEPMFMTNGVEIAERKSISG